MTHPKPPIALAVEAENTLQPFWLKMLPHITVGHESRAWDILRQAIEALRASTGHAKEIPLKAVDLVDAIRKAETIEAAGVLMADYLLASAQPEPRPLRELIAEGIRFFDMHDGAEWMRLYHAPHSGYLMKLVELTEWGTPIQLPYFANYSGNVGAFLDCPATPIPKPTGSPLPEDRSRFPSDRDWPEDFSGENGNYTCRCVRCRETFKGYKRRVICKLCDATTAAKGKQND